MDMTELFLGILNRSISAGWLIVAIVVLRLLLKRTPKWIICVLWCMVAVRLVIPTTFESAFSMIPHTQVIPRETLYETSPVIHSGIASVDEIVNPVLQENFAADVGASVNPLQVVTFAASYIWMLGIVVMVCYMLVSYRRLYVRVREGVLLEDNVYQSDRISSPFVMGVVKPRIYVPFTLEGEELECVIAHERAHIARLDYLLKPFAFLILSIYWFQPLVWVSYILLCRDIEYACDEKVLRKLGVQQKKVYSRALLRCSMNGNGSRKLITACPIAFGEVGVKNRIKSVLHYKKPTFWVLLISILACVVCAVCFMTEPESIEDIVSEEGSQPEYVQPQKNPIVFTPPEMVLQDALAGNGTAFSVVSETYSLKYQETADGNKITDIDAVAGNGRDIPTTAVKGEDWLQLYSYNDLEYAAYTVAFSKVPDEFTVKEYDLLRLGDITAVPESENTYKEMAAIHLKPRRIYEIVVEWSEEKLDANGFYGTAVYIFATDNELEEVNLAWHEVAYNYDMSKVFIEKEKIARIKVTRGWTGQEKAFSVLDGNNGFQEILDCYYMLNVLPDEEMEQRVGYQYCMRLYDAEGNLLQTVTPYKDSVCIDGVMYDGSLNGTTVQLMLLLDALEWRNVLLR